MILDVVGGFLAVAVLIGIAVRLRWSIETTTAIGAIATITLLPISSESGDFRTAVSVSAAALLLEATVLYHRQSLARRGGMYLVLAFFALALLGDLSSTAAVRWAQVAPMSIGCFLVAARCDRRVVQRVIVWLAILESIIAVAQFERLFTFSFDVSASGVIATNYRYGNELFVNHVRADGTLGQSLVLAALIIAAIGLTVRDPSISPRARFLTLAILVGGGLSSGGRSTLVISSVLIFLFVGRIRSAKGGAVRVVLFAAIVLVVVRSEAFQTAQSRLIGSGSYTNRLGSIGALPAIFDHSAKEVLVLGGGWNAGAIAISQGWFGQSNFTAVDNQFITTLLVAGLAGVLIMAVLLARALLKADRHLFPALLGSLATWFVFDTLLWVISSAIMFLLLGFALAEGRAPGPLRGVLHEKGRHKVTTSHDRLSTRAFQVPDKEQLQLVPRDAVVLFPSK